MNAAASALSAPAQGMARQMTLFEIDQALANLVESAQEEAAANGGELSEELKTALADYVEAFGEKVDRIASYLKAQEAFADLAKREATRLESRRRAAESRAKSLKNFLCFYMGSRGLKRLGGRLNTITLASNSVDTLLLDEAAQPPDTFYNIGLEVSWDEWRQILDTMPPGPLRERLSGERGVEKALDRTRLADAMRSGVVITGARLVRGQHLRIV
jgi:hypothetical protein